MKTGLGPRTALLYSDMTDSRAEALAKFVAGLMAFDTCGCRSEPYSSQQLHKRTIGHLRKTTCLELYIEMEKLQEILQGDASLKLYSSYSHLDKILSILSRSTESRPLLLGVMDWPDIDTSSRFRGAKMQLDGAKIWIQTEIPKLINTCRSMQTVMRGIPTSAISAEFTATGAQPETEAIIERIIATAELLMEPTKRQQKKRSLHSENKVYIISGIYCFAISHQAASGARPLSTPSHPPICLVRQTYALQLSLERLFA